MALFSALAAITRSSRGGAAAAAAAVVQPLACFVVLFPSPGKGRRCVRVNGQLLVTCYNSWGSLWSMEHVLCQKNKNHNF